MNCFVESTSVYPIPAQAASSKDKAAKKAPEGLPAKMTAIPNPQPALEVVGSKDGDFDHIAEKIYMS